MADLGVADMTYRKLPKWTVILSINGSQIEKKVEGYLEHIRGGGIQFVDLENDVIVAYAFSRWLEVMRDET